MSDGFGGDGFVGSGEVDNGDPPASPGLIVLQTTSGLSAANSYIDLVYLYAYANEVGFQIAIDETPTSLEQAILRAMPQAEARQSEFFIGRATSTQRTAFPRTGTYAGFARTTYIPEEIKRAQAAYTLAELSFTAATDLGVVHQGRIKRKREKLDVIEEETEYADGSAVFTNYGHARAKGDMEIEIIITNSQSTPRYSHPVWVG